MMKFTVKSLIALFVTSSALLLTPMRSDAQVNMKRLAEVAESCQNDVVSTDYYKQMGFDTNIDFTDLTTGYLLRCISFRYQYSLILSKFPWLSATGEVMPGYPGSVLVGRLAQKDNVNKIVDCLVTQDASSQECSSTRNTISTGSKIRNGDLSYFERPGQYLVYVCPSCVIAHDNVLGSQTENLKAFMQWFLTLDKPQRRKVISLLGDDDKASELRKSLNKESVAAAQEYWEARQRVERDEKERRRRELLGN
ncbi:hypothetical protein PN478_17870 [Dolichospermum circinale CS-534/05]|uniref:hypothetical protein n=1 Tax=Dolichospermum circinale TaxID=109265 RepID=UPI00232B87A0|nr:hypothetical protein [Dolichospermum circinale]MDB9455594.1 hypothetical protein [Dolichospermum circinale CS-541/06]MDB9461643.1 hypothetical protein [Dolichospermum circinale CS-541/04]MDB9492376.1 hypothetical protein [Dolichospermum circinale CS-534/05]MDB9547801.1 hypothetical protein [Dolichospermum circinale CS-1031]